MKSRPLFGRGWGLEVWNGSTHADVDEYKYLDSRDFIELPFVADAALLHPLSEEIMYFAWIPIMT